MRKSIKIPVDAIIAQRQEEDGWMRVVQEDDRYAVCHNETIVFTSEDMSDALDSAGMHAGEGVPRLERFSKKLFACHI